MNEPTGAETIVPARFAGAQMRTCVAPDLRLPVGSPAMSNRHANHLPVRPNHGATDRMSFTNTRVCGPRRDRTGGASGSGNHCSHLPPSSRVVPRPAGGCRGRWRDRCRRTRPLFVRCDLTDPAALRAALARVRGELWTGGGAGQQRRQRSAPEFPEVTPTSDWMMAVNCATFISVPGGRSADDRTRYGSIINMSSLA